MASKFRAVANAAGSVVLSAAEHIGNTKTPQGRFSTDTWFQSWRGPSKVEEPEHFVVIIQPGWAVKRPRKHVEHSLTDEVRAFDIVLSLSGVCPTARVDNPMSRTQRALISVAKRFAALPAIPSSIDSASSSAAPTVQTPLLPTDLAFADVASLSDAHNNLDTRLRPFWSSVAACHPIRLRIRASGDEKRPSSLGIIDEDPPLYEIMLHTDAQGHFASTIVLPWESICTYPPLVSDVFAIYDGSRAGHHHGPLELCMTAELLAKPIDEDHDDTSSAKPGAVIGSENSSNHIENKLINSQDISSFASSSGPLATASTIVRVSEPDGVRVLSDLDDTIKHSDILAGPREVFRNVFCRSLEDAVIRGMNTLYRKLAGAGVEGFHYVSNSPLELLPLVKEFFRIHDFPHHFSLKLKLYGRRSLITSLFESPGDRKRNSIVEILDAFSNSTFILFGDSGEQDLELYLALARARPDQILAIFIRDVTSSHAEEIRRSPLARLASTVSPPSLTPRSSSGSLSPTSSSTESWSSTRSQRTQAATEDSSPLETLRDTLEDLEELTAAQQKILKRAAMWDDRVGIAMEAVPKHIPLLLFRDPVEIEETVLKLLEGHDRKRSEGQA